MEQENNFETIITTWRRISGEKIESTSLGMAGDSSNSYEHLKKKDEDMDLIKGDKSKVPTTAVASASTAVAVADAATDTDPLDPDEKPLFTHKDKEESKEASGDSNNKKDSDYLEAKDGNEDLTKTQSTQSKFDGKHVDNVDSVYLRPPPPHKVRSQASTVVEEDNNNCAMSCLYCVVMSCECVLM